MSNDEQIEEYEDIFLYLFTGSNKELEKNNTKGKTVLGM